MADLDVNRVGSGIAQVPDYPVAGNLGFTKAIVNGTEYWRLFNDTGAALVDRTPYHVDYTVANSDTNGPRVIVLIDDAVRHTLVVSMSAVANQEWGWFAFMGKVDKMVVASAARTTGHALKVLDGVVTTIGAAPAFLDTEFGVILEATETSAAIDVLLYGREYLSTT